MHTADRAGARVSALRDRSVHLAALGSATMFDALGGEGWLEGLQMLWEPAAMAGPAFTVAGVAGDNLPLHRGVAEAPAGSILVAAMGGEVRKAVFGDVLARIAKRRSLRGAVIDAAVRDTDNIRRLELPVLCRARALRTPSKRCWGTLGEPVTIGRVTIATGDWIVADSDGGVVIPIARAPQAMASAQAIAAREDELVRRAIAGEPTTDQLGLRPAAPECLG
jgi:4-hydroxy-4-methyl-2-oxoglutarate aldolase